ncbi:hypothetical protein V5O48_006782 [Marasmius crinis-equi]|uniref:MARVEL domain-containing protein n=1 Tax=Marasmius crinis-equi TaxID=585013 RepID=A0ABR3FIJ2_9AGAR
MAFMDKLRFWSKGAGAEKEKEKAPAAPTPFPLAKVIYGLTFALIFAIAAVALGIDSWELHHYGDDYTNYPTKRYKHILGLILFNCIFTFLWMIGHFYISMGLSMFLTFVDAVFWGTAAGVLWAELSVARFGAFHCSHDPIEWFPANWRPYRSECGLLTALHGFCWAEWGILVALLFGSIIHKVEFRPRAHVVSYYGAPKAAGTAKIV